MIRSRFLFGIPVLTPFLFHTVGLHHVTGKHFFAFSAVSFQGSARRAEGAGVGLRAATERSCRHSDLGFLHPTDPSAFDSRLSTYKDHHRCHRLGRASRYPLLETLQHPYSLHHLSSSLASDNLTCTAIRPTTAGLHLHRPSARHPTPVLPPLHCASISNLPSCSSFASASGFSTCSSPWQESAATASPRSASSGAKTTHSYVRLRKPIAHAASSANTLG